jgi:hypothetical protein
MAFEDLSPAVQELVSFNIDFMLKFILMVIIIGCCILYIKFFKPIKKKTYLTVKWIRGILYYISWVLLFFSPLSLIFLYPAVPFDDLLYLLLKFYGIAIGILGLVITINIPFYGMHYFLELFGQENRFKELNKDFKQNLYEGRK